ncbi:MAG TPA: NAD-dependent 4,6-dehydratase LegB [Candidatus Cloacimonadota bacterium]|jgi:NAD dependent epimerase/dehydratase|nr:NAD-dependent 4,6-dehydratase LegB [Candidatus Cloacimonadales bacterium]HPY96055.1 NAD-dependent 4,6-dehydratase LegB [Candidatus Cloacimonadota bacterium]HQB40476.1 NAD-dependent 4,6-dehydratase LegB [Candidatus Cloacimonadota bacterium]
MNILVTGADGFIGSHLTELLLDKSYHVRALSYYNSFNYWGWLEGINHSNLEVVSGDIRDPFFCNKICKDIDIVFHLAALIAIPYSYHAPDSYVDTNVKGTLNICQAALDNKVKKVVSTSTSEVYGTAQYVPIDEKHLLQAQSPYSASKIGADAIAYSFYNSFGLPLVIARPFNTYGPRQSARALIPSVIIQILSGKKVIELGDLSPTRDFNYVKDIANGFLELALTEKSVGETVNIGSSHEISIYDTVQKICKIMGSSVEIKTDKQRLRPQNSEVFRLCCDNSKIKEMTGYTPAYTLDMGLKKTIEWFSVPANLKQYKADIYNI